MLAEPSWLGPVLLVAHDVRQVLLQPTPGLHGHDLQTAADAQDGHVPLQRLTKQGQLTGIPVGAPPCGLRVRRLVVLSGVEVGASGEHQTVEAVEQVRMERAGRGDDERQPTSGGDVVDVGGGHEDRGHVPDAPPGGLTVGGDPDHGLGHGVGPLARAASTSAANNGDCPIISGCHWTPTANRWPATSAASTRPSGLRAETTRSAASAIP